MNEVIQAIKNRRSVRTYEERQIGETEIAAIVEAGTYAPTAHNDQPWHFSVIQNAEVLNQINDTCRKGMEASESDWMRTMAAKPGFKVTYNAPTLIIVSGRKDAMAWKADCAAAIQNMLIAAESLGIGSVWLGLTRFFFDTEAAGKKVGIPDGYEYYYAVAFGYPANQAPLPAPKRNQAVVNYVR